MTEHTPGPADDAEAVRADIIAARAELSATVDALTDKVDVKARANDKIAEVKQKAAETVTRAKHSAPEPVQQALDRAGAKAAPLAHQVSEKAAPHRSKIIAGAAVALLALIVFRRSRSGKDDA